MSAVERYRAMIGETGPAPTPPAPTRMQGRNLVFGAGDHLTISVPQLDTDMIDLTPHDPLDLNDKTSYKMQVRGAEIALTDGQLSSFLDHEINGKRRTIRDFKIQFNDQNKASVTGKLTGLRIPFKIEADIRLGDDSQIGITVTKAKVMGIPVHGLLNLFKMPLSKVVTIEDKRPGREGFGLRGNTLFVDLLKLVETPKLDGHITGLRTQNGMVSVYMGQASPNRPLWLPHDGNFASFTGGVIQSNGMIVDNPTIVLRDKTPYDPFDIDNEDGRTTTVTGGTVTMPEATLQTTLSGAVGGGDFAIKSFDMTPRGGRLKGEFKGFLPVDIYLQFGRNDNGELTIRPHTGKVSFIPIPDGILRAVLKGVLKGARQEGDRFVIPSEMLGSTQLGHLIRVSNDPDALRLFL